MSINSMYVQTKVTSALYVILKLHWPVEETAIFCSLFYDVDLEKIGSHIIGIVKAKGAGVTDPLWDIRIIVGLREIKKLAVVSKACALRLSVLNSLNLNYPSEP